MKYKNLLNNAGLILAIGFFGCGNQFTNTTYTQSNQSNIINRNLPQVVATNSILCDLTKQVAGTTINLTCLIPPGIDPRIYQPTPEDIQAIEQANLIFYHGYNFEPGLIKIITSTKNRSLKIAVGQRAVSEPQQIQKNGRNYTEPHIWHNVKNTIKLVEVINSNLSKLSPKNEKEYSNNTKKITNELNQLHSWIKNTLTSIPTKNRKLLATHEAMIYYVKAYNLPYKEGLSSISNQDNLTNTKVRNLAQYIQQAKVPTVFADTTTNPMLIKPITKEANVKLFSRQLYIDGLGKPGSDGETYQKMMDANTRSIVEGLGGTYLKFVPNVAK
ncbi:zinc ABC transporter substrate-binding protein [Anabaena cylindrica FACHB-243]|uniref:ABC-type metal ion transporter, periplasmic subunit n=1 Tax=Anabaena cylindrica (strain ATCC 27899 / PCC 7122) TaxID=272123 RepID=K9ZF45_ANACC|nr:MULTISPECIES: zinc ABC transporter substrate-binding protein [Anabaena]AFZ57187.1 ABC-type metal ion transporter, periplasmic subunit [Anabaena cylindrica PCC 7122]MBD2420857.1 zinc ABC transporter substrate-binding protein [Anabaena cylindrica FACHB-243]MBY5285602.1 zinc ABC transporter solute-binding protein [Anabaena sp. CCAP 1446/1C]MBY5311724.1 zinc ABC transporter solute-binding protein [Anabaena sp. CCAP 1446/1C]MCM2410054.1 zinc ABC transporter substrate-binding protein [Anabaena sp